MKWRSVTEHVIESDAGYRVLECTADDVPTGRFVAFCGRNPPLVLGGYDSGDFARQACEAHFLKQLETA